MILIDTSAWIFALGPRPVLAIRERVQSLVIQNKAAITSPVLFELLSGARSQEDYLSLRVNLLSLHPFPLTANDWVEAAAWTRKLRLKDLSIKTVDALIAYQAIKKN